MLKIETTSAVGLEGGVGAGLVGGVVHAVQDPPQSTPVSSPSCMPLEQVFTTSYGEAFYPSIAVAYLIYLLNVAGNQGAVQQLYEALIYTVQDETRDYGLSAMHWHYLEKAGFKNMGSDEKLEQPLTPIFELANSYINKIACNIQV